jgi:cytochrome c553
MPQNPMPHFSAIRSFSLAITLLSCITARADDLKFNRDVRPILSNHCFTCHGPDDATREASLRLDQFDSATGEADSGAMAIVPGDSDASELIRRILADDPDERMPPGDAADALSADQIATLKAWIEAGAMYESHWAFVAPKKTDVPQVGDSSWPKNGIDCFVIKRFKEKALEPAPEATPETLIRRVAFDLTGLPPTLDEIDRFLSDRQPDAYQQMVERYLDSPAYGEHMARHWLDLARYADTNGYQYDTERQQWVWRDWVIDAYNSNKPFDQFTIEQIAGDLLPGATAQQRLATGFNRNHSITIEGGIIDEEYRTEYVMDRLNTTGGVWMGLTIGCARCHDHKYDPIAQREFYQLYSFFNQVPERGMKGFDPKERIESPLGSDRLASLNAQLDRLRAQLNGSLTIDEQLIKQIAKLEKQVLDAFPETMVMKDMPQIRQTHVLNRGQYNEPGEPVEAGVPAVFPPLPADAPTNRLGFAKWLVDPANPLTARVAVNRYWQRLFGIGLVKTSEDFGVQGELPSHPDLLDWLALEFIGSGWDIKQMHRLILNSATYRQTSHVGSASYNRDPENRQLTRGPRLRLDGEEIRDAALASGGLLVKKLGGKSVYPYQPKGLWLELNNRPGYSKEYQRGSGDDLYRRSMYTFWKRTAASPMMKTLDAPEREFCTLRRSRTNTPLQSLLLLNGPQFVEAARHLGRRMIAEGGDDLKERIRLGFRVVTARDPSAAENELLQNKLTGDLERYTKDPESATRLLQVGDSDAISEMDAVELAAFTELARLLLNLDEAITKG